MPGPGAPRPPPRLQRLAAVGVGVVGVVVAFCLPPARAKSCGHHLLPGVDKMARGVDITSLDLIPISHAASGNNGWKAPVLDLTCDEGTKWQAKDGAKFKVPDMVLLVTNKPTGIHTSTTKQYKSYDDIRDSMSASVSVGASYGPFAFSASASYASMQEAITKKSKQISESTYFTSARDVSLHFGTKVRLSPDAESIVKGAGNYSTNPEPYRLFIETFGTHYFTRGHFGGYIKKVFETESSYFLTKSSKEMQAAASASFYASFSASAGKASAKEKSTFDANSEEHLVYYGGDSNLLSKNGIQQWQPTVDQNPWLFSGKLKPLHGLVRGDAVARAGLEEATRQHVLAAYLTEAQRLVDAARFKLTKSNAQIKSLSNRLTALKNAKILNTDEVLKLKNDLTPPSWFSDNTRLCYKWRTESPGSGQCGHSDKGQECAKPNALTEEYRDDTDQRPSGCKLQWGVASDAPPPWFAKVQVCLKWVERGAQAQCGGGIRHVVCAAVDGFTSEYLDDTDARQGGCALRWRLYIPPDVDAPLWLHTTQLCMAARAAPGADASQCNKGDTGMRCALANDWTDVYVDDTDARKGGCLMRWGLKRLL